MKTEIANAIKIIQEATGCRVLLEPVVKMLQDSAETHATEVVPASLMATVPAKKTAKKTTKKAAKKVEPPITYITAKKFAELSSVSLSCVYNAIRRGKIAANRVKKTESGAVQIDSRCVGEFNPGSPHAPRRIECVELKREFPSMSAAAKTLKIKYDQIQKSVKTGNKVGGYHFKSI